MVVPLLAAALASPVLGATPVKTQIWLDGELVRTILPPAASPQEGTDPFFMVPGTGGVAAVGPGDRGYHGGHWAGLRRVLERRALPPHVLRRDHGGSPGR